jgi:hypothetical protein
MGVIALAQPAEPKIVYIKAGKNDWVIDKLLRQAFSPYGDAACFV